MVEKALIAAGCFWGIEEYFRNLEGIVNTEVGYTGGSFLNPTYEDVCSGRTGHAEAVSIDFNREILSYKDIINLFWKCHDPTQLNRQGLDVGTQYRSAIFFFNLDQKEIAEKSKKEFQKFVDLPVVTEINEAKEFYLAEEYHQCFLLKRK